MRKRILRTIAACGAAVILGGTATGLTFALTRHAAGGPFAHLTADQIVAEALKDMAALRSVHRDEEFTGGRPGTSSEEVITRQGCRETETLLLFGRTTVIVIGKDAWMKPGDDVWKDLGFAGRQFAHLSGKWIKRSTASVESDNMVDDCPITSMEPRAPSGWRLGVITRRHGIDELGLTSHVGKDRTMTLEVSVAVRPLILSATFTLTHPAFAYTAYFSDFNAPVTLTPPPPGDVLSQMPALPPGR